MRVAKTPAPVETKLDLRRVRVELYQADAASDPPNHPRVIVTVPGDPETLRADLPLSDVLSPKQILALADYQSAFVGAVLTQQGFAQVADPVETAPAAQDLAAAPPPVESPAQ